MNKLKFGLLTLFALLGIATTAAPIYVSAAPADKALDGWRDVGGTDSGSVNLGDRVKKVVNVILFVLGAAAVIMIIIGGFRYVVSGGDSSSVTAAKNTILYAVIGLVIAVLAYAIVNFVVKSVA